MAEGANLHFRLREGVAETSEVDISSPSEMLMLEILKTLKRIRTQMERSCLSAGAKGVEQGARDHPRASAPPPSGG